MNGYRQLSHFGENEKNANNQKKKVVIYTILFFNIIFFECPIVLSCTFWSVLSTVVLLQIENIKRKEFYDEH